MSALTAMINPEMLLVLEKEVEKYPTMLKYLSDNNLNSAALLSTGGVASAANTVNGDLTLVTECFAFLDTVDFLAMFFTSEPDAFTSRFINSIAASRVVPKPALCAMKTGVDTYTVTKKEDFIDMLENNRPLMALVFFSIIKNLFFK